jgi:hypothetical protein
VARRERQPGGEVFIGGPSAHVGSNFGDQLEGRVWSDAIDLREVDTAGEEMERGAHLEPRLVALRRARDPRRGHRCRHGREGGCEHLQLRSDGAIPGGQLGLTGIVESQILREDE